MAKPMDVIADWGGTLKLQSPSLDATLSDVGGLILESGEPWDRGAAKVAEKQRPPPTATSNFQWAAAGSRNHGGKPRVVQKSFSSKGLSVKPYAVHKNPSTDLSVKSFAVHKSPSTSSLPPRRLRGSETLTDELSARFGSSGVLQASGSIAAARHPANITTLFGSDRRALHMEALLRKKPRNVTNVGKFKEASAIAEVRALGGDEEAKEEEQHQQESNPHGALMSRLSGRSARREAENSKVFVEDYRSAIHATGKDDVSHKAEAARDSELDELIKATGERADQLQRYADSVELEVLEKETKLERVDIETVHRATEEELEELSNFERSQIKINEEKAEEDLARRQAAAKVEVSKVKRKQATALMEVRDFKVLHREYQRVRLEKLQAVLSHCRDGRTLRRTVREMIRHGQQRILVRLEATGPPLEPWMREVLVNTGHLELQGEALEQKLRDLRNEALKPKNDSVQVMASQSTQERFEQLFRKTADSMQSIRSQSDPNLKAELQDPEENEEEQQEASTRGGWLSIDESKAVVPATPEFDACHLMAIREAEADLTALRRLKEDMRRNIAATVCNRMQQADGIVAGANGKSAMWGRNVLSLLVSEDFAKNTMKEVSKSAPQGRMGP